MMQKYLNWFLSHNDLVGYDEDLHLRPSAIARARLMRGLVGPGSSLFRKLFPDAWFSGFPLYSETFRFQIYLNTNPQWYWQFGFERFSTTKNSNLAIRVQLRHWLTPISSNYLRPITTGTNMAMNQSEFLQLHMACSKRGKNRAYKVLLVLILLLIGW